MTLAFEQRGRTWVCVESEPSWPLMLAARNAYYGKDRLPVNLVLARQAKTPIVILRSHVDLVIASQRRAFAKESATRLRSVVKASQPDLETAIVAMVDGLLEHLLEARDEITVVSVADVKLPDDLTPKYVLWPIIPASRPGMLVAPSMMGKSTSALMMAISVATGFQFLPALQPKIQGPVLYIGQEETVEQFSARAAMVCKGHGIQMPKNLYCTRLAGGSLIDSAELLAEQAAIKHAVLVIIDSAQATWGGGSDNVREYASRWFNALEGIEVPALVIEHPNLEGTRKPGTDLLAAGTSVKRDRVGHAWQLKSVGIPPAEIDMPWRYHVTLSDTKRNYVSQQDDITYETIIYRHEWIKFEPATTLTPDIMLRTKETPTDRAMAEVLRVEDPKHDDGWLASEITSAIGAPDDRQVRASLKKEDWRQASWAPGTRYRFSQIEGTGSNPNFNPAKFAIDIERSALSMSAAPRGDDEMGHSH